MDAARTKTNNVAIFDMDACVSDDRHRRHLIDAHKHGNNAYRAYHDVGAEDAVLEVGGNILRKHIANGDFIVFITGRPIWTGERSVNWIRKWFSIEPNDDFLILMRGADDERPSTEVKNECLNRVFEYAKNSGRTISIAYDDQQEAVDMYRSRGLQAGLLNENGLFVDTPRASVSEPPLHTAETIVDAPPPHDYGAAWINSPPWAATIQSILERALETFKERNAVYGDNSDKLAAMKLVLFPDGVILKRPEDFKAMMVFDMILTKITRYVNSDMKHIDSIHDIIVYAAQLEEVTPLHGITRVLRHENDTSKP
jgi:hypothetical protein